MLTHNFECQFEKPVRFMLLQVRVFPVQPHINGHTVGLERGAGVLKPTYFITVKTREQNGTIYCICPHDFKMLDSSSVCIAHPSNQL